MPEDDVEAARWDSDDLSYDAGNKSLKRDVKVLLGSILLLILLAGVAVGLGVGLSSGGSGEDNADDGQTNDSTKDKGALHDEPLCKSNGVLTNPGRQVVRSERYVELKSLLSHWSQMKMLLTKHVPPMTVLSCFWPTMTH